MPRRPEQYEKMRDLARENIQTAAVRLFARHGFAATTMRQIAAAANVSAGLIYRYYASKEVLFEELLSQAVTGLAAMATTLREAEDPAHALTSVTESILTGLRADDGAAEFFLVMNHGFATDDPPGTAARLTREHTDLWDAMAELVVRGNVQRGTPTGDAAELTTCYFATISGLVTLRAAFGPGLPMPRAGHLTRPLVGDRA